MVRNSNFDQSLSDLQQLVAVNGSTQVFEKIYLLLYNDLHRFASRIISSNHIAEEIVSDVFVQLWKRRNELQLIKDLRIFLYVSVRNQALTYLHKAKRARTCWIEEFGTNSFREPVLTDHIIDEKETAIKLRQAIDKLPLKCKSIFLLVREDGLKYAEAARLLNLSMKTIENQMGIALKKIALHLRWKGKAKV